MSLFVIQPPEQYSHYDKPVIEIVLSQAAAINLCSKMVGPAFACMWREAKTGKCVIVIPFDGPFGTLAEYRSHERGHCAGWPANHAGWRW